MFCYENTENKPLHENTGVAHNGVESIDVKGHEVLTSIISNFPKQNKKIAHFCMWQLSIKTHCAQFKESFMEALLNFM